VAPRVLEDLALTGSANVLVVFVEQPDLRAARSHPTRAARGRFVYEALTRAALQSQAGLRAWLDARGVAYKAHYLGNLMRLLVDSELLDEIAARPEVAHIDANPWIKAVPDQPASAQEAVSAIEWGVARVGAPDLWAAGHRGFKAVVATSDTGVEWDHPALKTKYRGWNGSVATHNYSWHDAIDPLNGVPLDDHNHGTHVTGTMVGDDGAGNIIGVAPDARWIACRNMDHGNGTAGTYTECFEFFMAPYPLGGDPMVDGQPTLAPDVINNSWYCPPSEGCSTDTLRTIVEQVRAAGILVVGSAGNGGPGCSSVDQPIAIYDATFSVGATDSNDNIASFSSRGPVTADGSGRRKPDLSAPGVSVRSSIRGGNYANFNGTSMAGPHVAGVAALLHSANPALDGQPERMEALLLAGARPMAASSTCGTELAGQVPNNTFGTGIVYAPDSLDSDLDLDGFPMGSDNCPDDSNPDQFDSDLDGTGDACDCAPADPALFGMPGEAGPDLDWNVDGSLLSWQAASGATAHDVYDAPQSPGVAPTFGCLEVDLPGASASIAGAMAPGEMRSYVATGRSCFGVGTAGTASNGAPRWIPSSCP
jgi:subtilisin family serine protease